MLWRRGLLFGFLCTVDTCMYGNLYFIACSSFVPVLFPSSSFFPFPFFPFPFFPFPLPFFPIPLPFLSFCSPPIYTPLSFFLSFFLSLFCPLSYTPSSIPASPLSLYISHSLSSSFSSSIFLSSFHPIHISSTYSCLSLPPSLSPLPFSLSLIFLL